MQAALRGCYEARHDQDPDASAFVKNRAGAKRRIGANVADLATSEAAIPWLSLTNTIPWLAWVFVHVFSRPAYAERVRQDAPEATSTHGVEPRSP